MHRYIESKPNRYLSIMKPPRTVIDPEVLRGAAAQAVTALKLLANEQRLLLVGQLSQGEMCVGELEECLDRWLVAQNSIGADTPGN